MTLFIVTLIAAGLGFLIGYLCQVLSPGLSTAILKSIHLTATNKADIAFSIVYAVYFGLTVTLCFSIVAFGCLLLPTTMEMRQQMFTAIKVILLSLAFSTATTVAYASIFKGRIAALEIMTEILTSGTSQEDFRLGIYLAHSAFGGLFLGIVMAIWNLVRFLRTKIRLAEYLLNGDSTLAKAVSLIYPFNGLKALLVSVTVISLGWQLFLNTDHSYLRLFIFTYGSATWAIAAGYLYEFVLTKAGKNSELMSEFYGEMSDDIYVLVVFSLSVFVFYWRLPNPYAWTNLDLGLLAPPYFLYVLLTLYRCGKTKVAGHRFSQSFVNSMIGSIAVLYVGAFYVFYRIQTENITAMESLWWQITMFSTSITTFIGARLLLFYLRRGKLEGSPIWLEAFRTLKFSSGLYEKLVEVTPAWNDRVVKENARLRKEKRQQQKRRK
ncbi:hypothetical protein CEJ42_16455 [Herbaspirillum robiniae]|uniref:Uncharacterized protein n=1 Tax=Herbaspirillum robiniae TaxID=2014887 RepID=A0A246WPB1_9BURK|nr:hypothetical protein CEJ42_16455 [Herbaspirillum robiniae]